MPFANLPLCFVTRLTILLYLIFHCDLRDDFSYISEATVPIPEGNEVVTSYHHYYYHLFGTMYR